MPHLIIEHSGAGTSDGELAALTHALYVAFANHPLVPNPETLKIRTLAAGHLYFASGHDSFAHAHIHILPGRSDAGKRELAELACRVMMAALPQVGHFSADCIELGPGYTKISR